MKWYYTILGGHTHVRVFMNGAKCGDLCFRNEEFERIMTGLSSSRTAAGMVQFLPDNDQVKKLREKEQNERAS